MGENIKIELRNSSNTLYELAEDRVIDCAWTFRPTGGCGPARITLKAEGLGKDAFDGGDTVRIYKDSTLWYSGQIEKIRPCYNAGSLKKVTLGVGGLINQLGWIHVKKSYANKEISLVIKDILDNYVVPNTHVTYTNGDISTTGFAADRLEFDENALEAIRKLGELAGTFEWGVAANASFYFKEADSAVNNNVYYADGNVSAFTAEEDCSEIRNRIRLRGGEMYTNSLTETNGKIFMATYSNSTSIASYGLRENIVENAMITSDAVGSKWANSLMSTIANPRRSAQAVLEQVAQRVETALPVGRAVIHGVGYDDEKWVVEQVDYKYDPAGIRSTLSLGEASRPMPFEKATLAHKSIGLAKQEYLQRQKSAVFAGQPSIVLNCDNCTYVDGYQWNFPASFSNGIVTSVSVDGVVRPIGTNSCVIDYTNQYLTLENIQAPADSDVVLSWNSR